VQVKHSQTLFTTCRLHGVAQLLVHSLFSDFCSNQHGCQPLLPLTQYVHRQGASPTTTMNASM
jgi:hypothetical protein